MQSKPELTAVVVVGPRRERGAAALASLLAEAATTPLAVIVMDYEPASVAPIAGAEHPAVRYERADPDAHFGAARAAATRLAATPYVAFIEEHARVLSGWAAAVLRAFGSGPWDAVGFEVHNGNASVGRGWISGLMSYGLFMPPLPRGEATVTSGHNSAYRRDALLRYGDHLGSLLLADMGLFVALRRDGSRFVLEPEARIVHLNETTLASSLRAYSSYHRIYGVSRAREGRWSMARKLGYAAATPVIPIYYLIRFTRFLVRRSPADVSRFLRHAPYVYLAQLVGAGAQALGLLFGPGGAEHRFSRFEVSEPRPADPHAGDTP